ncbi:DUF732 domain-containing protein [Nocardia jiangxiensis]|uniref:DUF732 domain-containing protein n=1 Tax=Nocardia jiangxiensis TaxID=282685 RepID=A0ABW6RW08_9NOCA|nr:DUF732 domain-containing protein [Nocardia jiangxiensis]
MLRTSGKAAGLAGRGAAAGAAVAIASVLLLTGCGGNDSTASSTPTLKTSTTTAAATTTTSAPSIADSTTNAAPTTTTNEPPPAAVTPTLATPKITAKDQAFLDALKARGVTVSSPDIPLAVANYICQAKKSNVSPQEIQTYVNAMAGQDPSYDPNKMPIAQLGQTYVDVANQTYCNK